MQIVQEIVIEDQWESLVSEGIEARELKDRSQWRLGELADQVEVKYGDNSIGMFAYAIGVNKASLLRYRDVYRAFKGKEINPVMSFSHHMKAAATENPEEWIEKAYENSWSVEKLSIEINGNNETSRKCPVCGGRTGVKVCTCNK